MTYPSKDHITVNLEAPPLANLLGIAYNSLIL